MAANESIVGMLRAARHDDPEIWTVSDDSGTATLSVDVDGNLETLRLAPEWWRRVSPDDIGPLVMQLLQASTASRFQTITEFSESAGVDDESDAAPHQAASSGPFTESAGSADLTTRLGNLLAAFSELDRYRRSVDAATHEFVQLRSTSGNASLEVVGGSPRSLVIDPFNVKFTPAQALAAEIIDLFRQADHWLEDRRERALEELPELGAVISSVRERTARAR